MTVGQLNTAECAKGGVTKCACMTGTEFAQTCLLSDKQEQHTEFTEEKKTKPSIYQYLDQSAHCYVLLPNRGFFRISHFILF